MYVSIRDSNAVSESFPEEVVTAFQAKPYKAIQATAKAFSIPRSILQYGIVGLAVRPLSHKHCQTPSSTGERTPLELITQPTHTETPRRPR